MALCGYIDVCSAAEDAIIVEKVGFQNFSATGCKLATDDKGEKRLRDLCFKVNGCVA